MARARKFGKAEVEVSIRDRVGQGLKAIERRMTAFGSGLAKFGGLVTGLGTAGVAAFVPAIQAAGDFAETLSKFEAVFGSQADAVRDWANEYGKQVGRSEGQLLKFLGNAQDTFVPLGFDADEAEKFSKQLTQLAFDLASFNNISDQEAFDRLIGSMVGNTENLRAFGVVAQDAQIKAKALEMGFDPKNLSAYQKAQTIMKLAVEGTTAAQGDAVRTAGSFNNSIKALEASLAGLLKAVGEPLLEPLAAVAQIAGKLIGIVSTWISNNKQLIQTIFFVAAGTAAIGSAMVAAGVAIIGLGAIIGSVTTIASTAFAGLAAVIGFITSPITLVVAAIAGLGALAIKASGGLATLSSMFGSLGNTAVEAWGGIVSAISKGDLEGAAEIAFLALEVAYMTVTNRLKEVWAGVSTYIQNGWRGAVKGVVSIGAEIYFGVAKYFDQLSVSLINGFDTAFVYIRGAIDTITTAIAKAIVSAQEFFGLFSEEQGQSIRDSLDRDLARRAASRDAGLDRRSGNRAADLAQRDADRRATQDAFGKALDQQFAATRPAVDRSGLDAAQARLAEKQAALAAKAAAAQEDLVKATEQAKKENPDARFGDVPRVMNETTGQAKEIKSIGTSSAAAIAAGALGMNMRPTEEVAKNTAEANKYLRDMARQRLNAGGFQ